MSNAFPAINEQVGLLAKFAPGALKSLAASHPEHQSLLEPGMVLGEEDASSPNARDAALSVRLDTTRQTLAIVVKGGEKALPKIWNELNGAKKLEFVSQVLTAVGSAGVITAALALNKAHSHTGVMVTASFTLVASVLALGVKYKRGDAVGGGKSAVEQYNALRDEWFNARSLLQELKHAETARRDPGELSKIVSRADELAKKLYDLLTDLGVTTLLAEDAA